MSRPFTALLFVAVIATLQAATVWAQSNQPNFVFIIADDCTFRDIGCYGGQAYTPNIDRLASEGMKFENCFQTAPMCSPTRHNIYTGLYPVKSGAYPNHTFAEEGVKSVVQYLRPLGYRVALSGKTHIGPKSIFDFEYSVEDKNPDMTVVGQLFADCAESKAPFCLFACSNEPHTPWNRGDASRYNADEVKLPPYIVDTPEVREDFTKYLAEITYYDDQVGQILSMLEEHQLDDNTLVMVVSEQGNSLPFAKWTCYDNGLQSAMIVRWPGRVSPGTVSNAMVEYVDVLPTFVDIAGGEPDPVLDGKSFHSVLSGEKDTHKDYSYGLMTTRGIINGSDAYPIRSIRSKKYRLILNLNHEVEFTNALTQSKVYKSILNTAKTDSDAAKWVDRYAHRPAVELYDVVSDPMNIHNVADDPNHATAIPDLKAKLMSWMEDQGDQGMPTEMNAYEHQNGGKKKAKKSKQKRINQKKAGSARS